LELFSDEWQLEAQEFLLTFKTSICLSTPQCFYWTIHSADR